MSGQSEVSQKWGRSGTSRRMTPPHLCRVGGMGGITGWSILVRIQEGHDEDLSSLLPMFPASTFCRGWAWNSHCDSLLNLDQKKKKSGCFEYNFQNLSFGRKKQVLEDCPFPSPFFLFLFSFPHFFCLKSVLLVPLSARQLPGRWGWIRLSQFSSV